MLKLWHLDRSPFGWKVRMVLAHALGVPLDRVRENSKFTEAW